MQQLVAMKACAGHVLPVACMPAAEAIAALQRPAAFPMDDASRHDTLPLPRFQLQWPARRSWFQEYSRMQPSPLQFRTFSASAFAADAACGPPPLQETLQQLQHDRQHRWSTPSHMVAICMARKPHPKHKFNKKCMPLWEELAACACAVQNMQLMATSMGLGAYWSSWHDDARDSAEMLQFLGMDSTQGDR